MATLVRGNVVYNERRIKKFINNKIGKEVM